MGVHERIECDNTFIPLHVLAARLELPKSYLRELTNTGKIPWVGSVRRKRYHQTDVCNAIRSLNGYKEP